MSLDRPDGDVSPQLLAAYVDGELDAAARERVEYWLNEHPEALADLQDQESLSPANQDFWRMVAPPLPSAEDWDGVFACIEEGVRPAVPQRRQLPSQRGTWLLAPALALAGMAAALMIALLAIDRNRPDGQALLHPIAVAVSSERDEDEETVFRVATADDVEIIQLPEEAVALLVVGKHPMEDVPLVFASAIDIQVLNYGPDDQGAVPDHQTMQGPDTPMFVAPAPSGECGSRPVRILTGVTREGRERP